MIPDNFNTVLLNESHAASNRTGFIVKNRLQSLFLLVVPEVS